MKRMRLGLLMAMGLGLAACQQKSVVADPASPMGEQGFATVLRNKLLDAKSGDVIEAFNERGSFQCACVATEAVRPGTAVIIEGIWDKYMVSGNLQNVTNDAANPRGRALAKGRVTPFNDTLIEVKKA